MHNNYNGIPEINNNSPGNYSPMIEVLKKNHGKQVEMFFSFPNSIEWKDKAFRGIIENSGYDYICLSDPSDGNWYIVPLCYINFIKFEEQISLHN